jgi:two-component system OmpR family sensor kinase
VSVRSVLRPRTVRSRLLLTVVVSVGAALVLMTVGFNLLLWRGLSNDANALARSRAAVEAGAVDVVNDRVVPPEVPDTGGMESQSWLLVAGRAGERPNVGAALDRAALGAAATPGVIVDVPAEKARLYAVPAVVDGKPVAVVVAAVSLAPYEATRRIALIGSLALAAALLVVVTLVTRWVLAAALRPVAEMTAAADAWSTKDLDRRFAAGDPHDELGQLAATLDRLLDRIAASLRREQRFSAELSHELRTPLAKIRAEAELALRREREPAAYRETLRTVERNVEVLTRTADTLVAASRQESGLARGSVDVAAALGEAAEPCAEMARARGVQLNVDPPTGGMRLGVDPDVAARILHPLVENACRYASTEITLSARAFNGQVLLSVQDDGPGILPAERESIFEAGVRGSAATGGSAPAGAGLGLTLARRLARAAAGDVDADVGGRGGRFVVRLPAG